MKTRGLIVIALFLLMTACGEKTVEVSTEPEVETITEIEIPAPTIAPKPVVIIENPAPEEPKWTDDELWAMSLTLAGECYDDKEDDKRLVCEVILNRVSDGNFGDSILEVITAENQFFGYWYQPRSVSESDLQIAEQALDDWFNNDCEALSEYLFFCAGDNRENRFREKY